MEKPDQESFPARQAWFTRRSVRTDEQPRVVVVDDNAAAADAVCVALGLAGYQTCAAYSAAHAVAECERANAHVVLLDINMPQVDGHQTAGMLRSRAATREIIIVAYTALPLESVAARIMPGSFDGYCRKGAAIAELVTWLASCFEV
ncbi:response regulator [Paraburkholderia guartelaensis]|uniref:Response regulator n=1 Tax=Paraburkholderia guartelaensis TaxID=2546446 RepID=A0A4V2ZV26_9BURK|nr:response regulator [Paraburkholderia guartelaensis]TDG03438.1 response regulator [Paraburkholderia guartelaensis]